jgi:hypothetical protein
VNLSNLELSKNRNIQARFDTKDLGTVSRVYRLTLTDGTVANVIFNDGENLSEAIDCLQRKYGEKLSSVVHG